ncbi:MAG: hypothetical protein A4E32_01704 [Methanomassiliicoccales archaeon PtaU1.Bin124]|nr:MAG: hypothetical protein A4E32_01704 [Methanomassiliicoccales archaeon PtaU1.Bin124]
MGRMVRLAAVLMAIGMLACMIPMNAGAGTPQAPTDAELAARYAPILNFKNGERCFPVEVEYFIQNCNLNRSVGGNPTLVDSSPTISELASYSGSGYSDYYLDNRLGSVNDDRIIKAYQQQEASLGYTVYYHIYASSSSIVIQYWLFYVFNPATYNNHEGDWEMVQVTLDASYAPVSASFSQHESGMEAGWDLVERSGDNIKVYVALGSHANYFRPYQGKTGMAQDSVGNDGKVLDSSKYDLVDMGELSTPNTSPNTAWIKFGGHWGDYGSISAQYRGERGPLGPAYRQNAQMWNDPVAWSSSLVVLDNNMLLLDQVYTNFIWIVIGFLLLAIVFMVLRILKRKKDGESLKPICAMLEFKGRIGIANILAIAAVVIAIIGAFLPYYTASANITTGQFQTPGWVDVFSFSGVDGLMVNGVDDQGVPYQLAAIALPFGMLIFLSMALLVIGSVVTRRKKMPMRYISKGITLIVVLVMILVVVMSISALEPMFHQIEGGDGAVAIVQEIAKNPIGGSTTLTVPSYGQVDMKWGLGIGALLMVIAGIMLLVAGLMYRTACKEQKAPTTEAPKSQ